MDMDSETMTSVIKRLALDRAGFKIISTGLQQCALDRGAAGEAERAQLEKLFLALA